MYRYNEQDKHLIEQRALQFKHQTERFLAGKLGDAEFRSLRLMNGLYEQVHAPMLRIAIPYGLLSSVQVRKLAEVAQTYDKGYGHFTTRQNMQFNWIALEKVPEVIQELNTVEMHSIQTSGNCIRNITSDPLAGVAGDEVADPRPYCEILRQWSTLHPEFAFLPRKFKIAVSGAEHDRVGLRIHDIGVQIRKNEAGETGFRIYVGGGLGRTPILGQVLREFLPERELLAYLDATLQVYNRLGRRDNLYKARIKILVKQVGIEEFARQVEARWQKLKQDTSLHLTAERVQEIQQHFIAPEYAQEPEDNALFTERFTTNPFFSQWVKQSVTDHKVAGYSVVTVSLKSSNNPPGDITTAQLNLLADLADQFNFGELRTTHTQNIVFSDVRKADVFALWQALKEADLASPNVGTLTDMICCPGSDFCNLANATAIPIAQAIQDRFSDLKRVYDLGDLRLNISGCINACAHHHVGHIGILGVEKSGEDYYQLMLGGSSADDASLAKNIGRAIAKADIADAIENVIAVYVENRKENERFIDTYRRIGVSKFKERVYATH